MSIEQLKQEMWTIERNFHNEECVYYFTAQKGRNILTSDDGITFHGLISGEWF